MPIKILFLADADSSHTMKWAVGLHDRGLSVAVFSLRKCTTGWNEAYPAIRIYDADAYAKEKFGSSDAGKISYLRFTDAVKNIIAEFKPDIVHAHYATSYGLLGVKTKFHPLVISAWGSDVFDFPERSILHRYVVKRNLKKADAVFSTSEIMKKQIQRLGRKEVHVTPFGVDLSVYRAQPKRMFGTDVRVIGTIKTLEQHYGIDILIQAFAKLRSRFAGPLKLVICGDGSQRESLKQLAALCGCKEDVIFTGALPQPEVVRYLNAFDIFANLSRRESFGVSVIEAMACEVPVVVSDAAGPKEITENGVYGEMVPAGNAELAVHSFFRLLNDDAHRTQLIAKAKQRVHDAYDWQKTLDDIIAYYTKLITA
jgi:glycosyltransferase involved in cell wall biosynthesis